MEITTEHGTISNKTQTKLTNFYNLDMIIVVGYRVNSKAATKFRQWATDVLRDYIIKGYKLDKEILKNSWGIKRYPSPFCEGNTRTVVIFIENLSYVRKVLVAASLKIKR